MTELEELLEISDAIKEKTYLWEEIPCFINAGHGGLVPHNILDKIYELQKQTDFSDH